MLPGLCQTFLCHLDFSSTGKKAFARRTQMDADEGFLFRICVNWRVLRANPDSVAALPRCGLCGKMISRFPRFSIISPGIREIMKSLVKFFRNRSSITELASARLAKW
jgi:hypothetical protein